MRFPYDNHGEEHGEQLNINAKWVMSDLKQIDFPSQRISYFNCRPPLEWLWMKQYFFNPQVKYDCCVLSARGRHTHLGLAPRVEVAK